MTKEHDRLLSHREFKSNWKKWGPYLSDRSWGTIREDYSSEVKGWDYFPFSQSKSRVYRWNEDGLGGISDRSQYLCFSYAFWNEKDSILKERFFGLSNNEGNHGEDLKEYYFHLDNTPCHTYMAMLYKYPQEQFPYEQLILENSKRGYQDLEYELIDTGIFNENAYFDILLEYCKADQEDLLLQATFFNRSEKDAGCYILPTLWFRNTWSFGYPSGPMKDVPRKPQLHFDEAKRCIVAEHVKLGTYYFYAEEFKDVLFTENETNFELLFKRANQTPYVKDAFHRFLVHGEKLAVNPAKTGTKSAFLKRLEFKGKESKRIRLRLTNTPKESPFERFDAIFLNAKKEADDFYESIQNPQLNEEEKNIQRKAFAGMLWTKQLYYFDIEQWVAGDPVQPLDAKDRKWHPNYNWDHLVNFDILSMPDKWEYPWFASWDLAFHCIPLVMLDSDFAKRQVMLMTREWYMHPNGQLPAYEWNFNDVNPPVHAWAAWRVYKIDAKQTGKPDRPFLQGIFHKLLLNFTWWVNRKDREGNNIFQGGFLGMDNISLFNRSAPLPAGGYVDQADATSWMAFYCLTMMKIALELAKDELVYEDSATKFFEHFLRISSAMNNCGGVGQSLYDEDSGFFYDVLHLQDGDIIPLKVRSMVGLLPLLGVEVIDENILNTMKVFRRRVEWFLAKRPDLTHTIACVQDPGKGERKLMATLTRERLLNVLRYMLDEKEFLSPCGIRSLSKRYQEHPFTLWHGWDELKVRYLPAEADSGLYGGNSNWRGPVWFPLNYLLIESLQKFHHYYGDELKVEFPTGSKKMMSLWEVSMELEKRLISIFMKDSKGYRPLYGGTCPFQVDPLWNDQLLFYEYFNGDNGAGLGASHQTGWTALIAKILQQKGKKD